MRTTVTIDSDVQAAARSLARARSESIGAALTDLARRGLSESRWSDLRTEFPVFAVPDGAPTITLEDVRAIEDGGW